MLSNAIVPNSETEITEYIKLYQTLSNAIERYQTPLNTF